MFILILKELIFHPLVNFFCYLQLEIFLVTSYYVFSLLFEVSYLFLFNFYIFNRFLTTDRPKIQYDAVVLELCDSVVSYLYPPKFLTWRFA